jgi:polysaccharide deacetylase family protein (PEP-CTERM system associated)
MRMTADEDRAWCDARSEPINALTVDLEDYFQVEAFATTVNRDQWPAWQSRIEYSSQVLLELFGRYGVSATFFVLGWIAERHPDLIRTIAAAGHEIACHGYEHRLIYRQTPSAFHQDIRRAKVCLEDIVGRRVSGYRAPTYSITTASLWAFDILIEEGFHYDSSVFPIHHDRYGIPSARRFRYTVHRPAGDIVELPPSTLALGPVNLPLAGGGYFRLLPYALFRLGLRHINRIERQAAVFLVHPWEVDPGQPVIAGSRLNVLRHRLNLGRTLLRLERLLSDFRFAPVSRVLWPEQNPVH